MYRRFLPWYAEHEHRLVALKHPREPVPVGRRFVLLNWNVHKNNHAVAWLEDFSGMLLRYRPDLILFQEYRTMNRKSVLDKHAEYGYGFFPNIVYKQHHYGLVSASRSRIVEVASYSAPDLEPIVKTPKITLETLYETEGGGRLRVVNVHMINFVKLRKFMGQIDQLEHLLSRDAMPLILAGDFNTWNRRRMHIVERLVRAYGLRDVLFPGATHRKAPFPCPLDHVFYRGLEVEHAEVPERIETSDHKPLLVTFATK